MEHMHALIEALAAQAGYLLFDSPPVLAVTDAAILSSCMGRPVSSPF